MKNIKLNPMAGSMFGDVAKEAREKSTTQYNCEFEFNGILCIVDLTTNLEWLYRDYANAHTMQWKSVGPKCTPIYSSNITKELESRRLEQEKKAEIDRKAYKDKEDAERLVFENKVKGVEFECVDVEKYNEWKDKNSDSYGKATFEYAEGWDKLMQIELNNGKTLKDIANKTSFELGFLGISGAMHGFSVGILSECWKYGEGLKDALK